MSFKTAKRRLDRLFPSSAKNKEDEEIRRVLAPLTVEQKIAFRDILERYLERHQGSPPTRMPSNNSART
jgi:hypothetical protein